MFRLPVCSGAQRQHCPSVIRFDYHVPPLIPRFIDKILHMMLLTLRRAGDARLPGGARQRRGAALLPIHRLPAPVCLLSTPTLTPDIAAACRYQHALPFSPSVASSRALPLLSVFRRFYADLLFAATLPRYATLMPPLKTR